VERVLILMLLGVLLDNLVGDLFLSILLSFNSILVTHELEDLHYRHVRVILSLEDSLFFIHIANLRGHSLVHVLLPIFNVLFGRLLFRVIHRGVLDASRGNDLDDLSLINNGNHNNADD
jgi:hypothetical protein